MPERRSFSQPPRQPRPIVRIVVMLVLIIACGSVIHMLLNRPTPSTSNDESTANRWRTDPTSRDGGSPLTGGLDMIDEPLATEPAGLPAWPGEGATRGFGFRRPLEGRVDEVVVWQLPADASAAEVTAFYDAAAKALKFERPPARESEGDPPPVTTAIYRRASDAGLQTLTIRLAESTDGLRVTLWFQYPIATPGDDAAVSPSHREAMHE